MLQGGSILFLLELTFIEKRRKREIAEWLPLDELMEDLRLYVLFNHILVISGRWAVGNGRLRAMKRRLRLNRSLP